MISIVIPLFNEEENIKQLYSSLKKASDLWNDPYEIIFIDDGSFDETLDLLKQIGKLDFNVKIIKLSRNFGHQAALTAGLKYAEGDAVIVMDGDMQDPPEAFPLFLKKWREGYHVVYGIRKNRKEGWLKKISYKVFYRILKLVSNIDIPLDSGDFCLMDKRVVKILNTELVEHNRFIRGLRAYAGFKQIGVEFDRNERAAGKAKFTFKKLVKLAIDGLLDFSTFPLRIATYLGFIIAFSSFLIGTFFILNRVFEIKPFGYSPSDTPGIVSLAVGIFFLSGLMLIILGLLGEYIGRIYFEVKKRPVYIIEEIYREKELNQ